MVQHRPYTTVILAMSADGKIADVRRSRSGCFAASPARFGSKTDIVHLEEQITFFQMLFYSVLVQP
jgi:5-amino-6-(5-phosphoribosylamino)uracil reductase